MNKRGLRKFLREDTAQDLAEYAFLLGFIALVTLIGINATGGALLSRFQAASTAIEAGS